MLFQFFWFIIAVSFVPHFSFVCALFLSLLIAMNVILFWFSILFIYVIFNNIPNLWSSILERCLYLTLSLSLFFFLSSICCLLLWTHTQTHKHSLIDMHIHSYINNAEVHLHVFSPFPFYLLSMCVFFLSRCPCLFMTNVCHFYFSHTFSFVFDFFFRVAAVSI